MVGADKIQSSPKGLGVDIATMVKQDIESRALLGIKKYGERLLPNNGRDSLLDAYQEALDLCMYLRQVLEERQQINDKIALKLEYILVRLQHNTGTEWRYECMQAANECLALLHH